MGSVIHNLFTFITVTLITCSAIDPTNNENCSWFCNTQTTDKTDPCTPIRRIACPAEQPSVGPVADGQPPNKPTLSSIHLQPAHGMSPEPLPLKASLVLDWSLDYDVNGDQLSDVVVEVDATDTETGADVNGTAVIPYCAKYDLSGIGTNWSKVILRDSCSTVTGASVYNVTLTVPQQNMSMTYYVKTPNNISTALNPSRAVEWEPVVAVALDVVSFGNATVYVLVEERAPEGFNISSNMTLYSTGSKEYTLEFNGTKHTFVVTAAHTYYFAQIKLFSSNCTYDLCRNLTTPHVFIDEFPSRPLVPTTPPKTTPASPDPPPTEPVFTVPESSPEPTDPVIPPDDNNKSKYVVVGLVVGLVVIVALLAMSFAIHKLRKRKHNPNNELSIKASPSILVLYSCDCPSHEQVVVEFVSYLKHTFYCNVSMDLWEQNDIQARGAISWLLDKLETCHYVIVVCSAGARLKCVRGRSMLRPREDRPVPDIFPVALDYVAEKMWLMRNEDKPLDNFMVVCFDYAGENDIPPKLDLIQRYYLPADLPRLFCHIYVVEYTEDMSTRKDFEGRTAETIHKTDTGKQLMKAISNAKDFFANNPNWLLEELEKERKENQPINEGIPVSPPKVPSTCPALQQVVPPPTFYEGELPYEQTRPLSYSPGINSPDNVSQRTDTSENRPTVPLNGGGGDMHSLKISLSSVASEEEALLEQRNKKRNLDMERPLNNIPKQRSSRIRKSLSSPRKKSQQSPMSPKSLQEGWSSMVRNSKKFVHHLKGKHGQGYSNLSDSQLYSSDPAWDGVQNGDIVHSMENGELPSTNGNFQPNMSPGSSAVQEIVSEDSDSLSNEEQLQKDVDFIQNFHIHAVGGVPGLNGGPPLHSTAAAKSPSGVGENSNHSFTNPMCLLSPLNGNSVMNGDVLPNSVPSHVDECNLRNKHKCLQEIPLSNNNDDISITFE